MNMYKSGFGVVALLVIIGLVQYKISLLTTSVSTRDSAIVGLHSEVGRLGQVLVNRELVIANLSDSVSTLKTAIDEQNSFLEEYQLEMMGYQLDYLELLDTPPEVRIREIVKIVKVPIEVVRTGKCDALRAITTSVGAINYKDL